MRHDDILCLFWRTEISRLVSNDQQSNPANESIHAPCYIHIAIEWCGSYPYCSLCRIGTCQRQSLTLMLRSLTTGMRTWTENGNLPWSPTQSIRWDISTPHDWSVVWKKECLDWICLVDIVKANLLHPITSPQPSHCVSAGWVETQTNWQPWIQGSLGSPRNWQPRVHSWCHHVQVW